MLFSLSLLPEDVQHMLVRAGLALIALQAVSYIASLWVFPASKDRAADVSILLHAVFQPYLSYYAVKAFFNTTLTCTQAKDMWYVTSEDSKWVLALGIVHSSITLFNSFLSVKTTMTYKCQILAHHVTVVYCFTLTALGHGHGFTSMNALSEITSVFLNNVYLFKKLHWNRPLLVASNGFFLWLGFVVLRLVMFPVWLYLYYTVCTQPDWEEIKMDFADPMRRFWFVGFVANALLLCLSLVWFVAITKGLLKVVENAMKSGGAKKVDWKEIQTPSDVDGDASNGLIHPAPADKTKEA